MINPRDIKFSKNDGENGVVQYTITEKDKVLFKGTASELRDFRITLIWKIISQMHDRLQYLDDIFEPLEENTTSKTD